jgi:hypothetical protein
MAKEKSRVPKSWLSDQVLPKKLTPQELEKIGLIPTNFLGSVEVESGVIGRIEEEIFTRDVISEIKRAANTYIDDNVLQQYRFKLVRQGQAFSGNNEDLKNTIITDVWEQAQRMMRDQIAYALNIPHYELDPSDDNSQRRAGKLNLENAISAMELQLPALCTTHTDDEDMDFMSAKSSSFASQCARITARAVNEGLDRILKEKGYRQKS